MHIIITFKLTIPFRFRPCCTTSTSRSRTGSAPMPPTAAAATLLHSPWSTLWLPRGGPDAVSLSAPFPLRADQIIPTPHFRFSDRAFRFVAFVVPALLPRTVLYSTGLSLTAPLFTSPTRTVACGPNPAVRPVNHFAPS